MGHHRQSLKPARNNRLDLEIKVATVSEALSYSSAYAFHNLGGIDRSVRVFALPPIHVRQMHLNAGLDRDYRDGTLHLSLGLESASERAENISVAIKLHDPTGKTMKHSTPVSAIESFQGSKTVEVIDLNVTNPLQWSAEKPNLYHLTLELQQCGKLLERIEREIGFRTVEIHDRQLFVNGRKVKLAGACHHEFDPLTGRAEYSDPRRRGCALAQGGKSQPDSHLALSALQPNFSTPPTASGCTSKAKRRFAGLAERSTLPRILLRRLLLPRR